MNSGLSCNTVKDLLPIYLDGIASEETNIQVKKHLSECELCQSEYKKLCEIIEKNEEIVMNNTASIKTLQKRLRTWFITVIVLGIVLVSMAIFCFRFNPNHYTPPTFLDLISFIPIYVVKYFLPLLGLFVAIIWKKTIPNKEKVFWPNVIISFLAIWILSLSGLLLWRFFLVIRFFY